MNAKSPDTQKDFSQSKKLQTFAFSYRESPRSNLVWSEAFEARDQAETAREAFAEACGGWRGVDGRTADGTVVYSVDRCSISVEV